MDFLTLNQQIILPKNKPKRNYTKWTFDMEEALNNYMRNARQISKITELELCRILVNCHGLYPNIGAVTNKWSKLKRGIFSSNNKRSNLSDIVRLNINSVEMQYALRVVHEKNLKK